MLQVSSESGAPLDVWSKLAQRCRIPRETAKRLGYRAMWNFPANDVLQVLVLYHLRRLLSDAKLSAR